MASGKPMIRQIAWISVFPQFFVMGVLVFVFLSFVKPFEMAVLLAMIVYLVITITLRRGIARNHRKGISLYKKENYAQAIEEFKKSYAFFRKYSWIDKYRYITLSSSSRISFTEMALNNIAYCYAQSGNGELSKQYYQKTLELFPDSEMAKSALNMIASFENNSGASESDK